MAARKTMLKILTIIGARPQIIKAAALSRAIKNNFTGKIREIILHTGQHYDTNMSRVFFDELQIPLPQYNLNIGSGTHAQQTSAMINGIEEVLLKEKPGYIVLYGDTNSTLAGAIAASKIAVPIVHIEAGLRSYNKNMPEEINRILCDHVSTLLFSPTKTGFANLVKEGFRKNTRAPYTADNPKIYHCGDVMYDNSLYFAKQAEHKTTLLKQLQLQHKQYVLATIHRNNNTDDPKRLTAIFKAILKIIADTKTAVVLPLHPRTSKQMENNLPASFLKKIYLNPLIKLIPPASFLEMIALEKNCKLVMTDSGGVQKEAFFFKKPCIILRSETEWIELVKCGSAIVTDVNENKIVQAFNYFSKKTKLEFPSLFGNGKAAEFICREMYSYSIGL